MDLGIFKEFIMPELVLLAPVLYIIGLALKNSGSFQDKYIPIALIVTGIVLAIVYVLGRSSITTMQDGFNAAFTAITQGCLCAGGAIGINQAFVVQPKKEE